MRRFVTLDLETVPDEELVAAVDGEAGRPYPEQLRRLLEARRARGGARSDFLPLPYHRPVAACLLEAVEDGGVVVPTDAWSWGDGRGSEAEAIDLLWRRLEGATAVTFHGRGFDLPVLALRSLKLGIPAPGWYRAAMQPGSAEHADVKELLAAPGSSGAAPLDLYAKLVGLPGKQEVAGADVAGLHAAGDLDRIVAYCMSDVVQTFLLWLRTRLVDGTLGPDGYAESAGRARVLLPGLLARGLGAAERAHLEPFLARCAPFLGAARPSRRRALSRAARG